MSNQQRTYKIELPDNATMAEIQQEFQSAFQAAARCKVMEHGVPVVIPGAYTTNTNKLTRVMRNLYFVSGFKLPSPPHKIAEKIEEMMRFPLEDNLASGEYLPIILADGKNGEVDNGIAPSTLLYLLLDHFERNDEYDVETTEMFSENLKSMIDRLEYINRGR